MNRQQLEKRVAEIGGKALKEKQYVSSIDILLSLGWLQPVHLAEWRKGRITYLERAVQANLAKIGYAMKCFRQWASKSGLKPIETSYKRRTRSGMRELRFSKSGVAKIEAAYRTHYFLPELSAKQQEKLKEKRETPPEQKQKWRCQKTADCDSTV